MKELILIVVIFLNLNTRVSAGEVFGLPVVTDGDTIKISNNKTNDNTTADIARPYETTISKFLSYGL